MKLATDVELGWDRCSRTEWDGYLTACGRSSLEQSWGYGVAVESGSRWRTRRVLVSRGDRSLAMAQVFERPLLAGCLFAQIVRGPLWLEPLDDGLRLQLLRTLRSCYRPRRRRLLYWMPELLDTAGNEDVMRQAGLRRMVTGHSSAWLDLRSPEPLLRKGLHGKWRNALVAAERDGLEVCRGVDAERLDWLLGAHDRFRRQARFLGPGSQLIRAIVAAAPDSVEMLTAHRGGRPLAGVLAMKHGRSATYYAGYSGREGRLARAQNLLLWQCVLALKRGGTDWFEVGGFDGRTPGIARFKLGLGGEPFTLSGSYL